MVRLNRTYFFALKKKKKKKKKKITSKIFKIIFPSQIPANYANSVQFAPTVRELCKIRTFR